MMPESGPGHTIRAFFADRLRDALRHETQAPSREDVEDYLSDLLVRFMHHDHVFAIRNAEGRRLESVAEMLAEGDVRLNASSFEREREVHRHIGDFLLFWTGFFPEATRTLGPVDPLTQGRHSYHVVSTFTHDPYGAQADTFRVLSQFFEDYRFGLRAVRTSIGT